MKISLSGVVFLEANMTVALKITELLLAIKCLFFISSVASWFAWWRELVSDTMGGGDKNKIQ